MQYNVDIVTIHEYTTATLHVISTIIAVMPGPHYGVLKNHRQHDCIFSSLFGLTWKKTSKLTIIGFLCGKSTDDQGIHLTECQ